ncbi:hypothetical protein FXO38_08620 [Capsicum annuum]|nr:hypothetical protein FXO38_08620 [Capsicum annuum]KAF3670609.1 hypothetical protein FXO37_08471 [Capsicum annuum]
MHKHRLRLRVLHLLKKIDEKGVHFPLNAQKSTVSDVGTASPVQTVTDKDKSSPLMAVTLPKSEDEGCSSSKNKLTRSVDLQVAPPQQRVNQHQQAQLTGRTNQPVLVPGAAANPNAAGNSRSSQSQLPWRRMSRSDYQKYSKVFMAVDTDRDGKITGQEARNLFLSWKLPRGLEAFNFDDWDSGTWNDLFGSL